MGLTDDAATILDEGRLPSDGPQPRPVAFMRGEGYGAVMFLTAGRVETTCIVCLVERGVHGWQELTVVQKPWWDPSEEFAAQALLATGGHSRFTGSVGTEIVVIPGQAAPDTTVARIDRRQSQPIAVHPPRGHFVYAGTLERDGDPVTLVAERGRVRQTATFERLDLR